MRSPEFEIPRFEDMSIDELLEEVSGRNMVASCMNLIAEYKESSDIQKTRDELRKKLKTYTQNATECARQLKSLEESRLKPAFKDNRKNIEQAIRNVKGHRFNLLIRICKLKYKLNILDLILKRLLR